MDLLMFLKTIYCPALGIDGDVIIFAALGESHTTSSCLILQMGNQAKVHG